MFKKNIISISLLSRFSFQWQLLIANKVPMDRSLQLLQNVFQKEQVLLRRLKPIINSINQGNSVYDAFATQQRYFPDLFLQLILAGERSGDLERTLGQAAEYYENQEKFRKKIIQSLTYPMLTVIVAIFIVLFMLFFIIPSFAEIYSTLDANVPAFTMMLINLSIFLEENAWYIAFILLGTIFLIYNFRSILKSFFLGFGLRLPFVGELIRIIFLGKFTYSMSILIDNAIPLVEALSISRQVSNYKYFRFEINALVRATQRGDFFQGSGTGGRIFTPLLLEMIKTGEHTGRLGEIFSKMADYYHKQLEYNSALMMSIIEPIIIIAIGIIVGAIVIALYIPMFEISSGFGG